MTNPMHEIAIPLNKPVNAWYVAMFAKQEWQTAIDNVMQERYQPNPDAESGFRAFWLADAAEWRRVYQSCIGAIEVMGGL